MEIRTEIPISEIKRVSNIRNEDIEIQDFMDSIAAHGLLQTVGGEVI